MKLELSPGEKVTVTLEGTDGEITIDFGYHALEIRTDVPDDTGRQGILYREEWNPASAEK